MNRISQQQLSRLQWVQGQGEHMRESLKEEEQLLIITRLHQACLSFMSDI